MKGSKSMTVYFPNKKALVFLIIFIFTLFAIVVCISYTPVVTWSADSIPTGYQMRDMSTPSSRLVGHWSNVNGYASLFYDFIDPKLKVGTFHISSVEGNTPKQFKVLSEELKGEKIRIREFLNGGSVEVEFCIPKDGQSMTKEYLFNDGSHSLFVYNYVDGRVDPSSSLIPLHPK